MNYLLVIQELFDRTVDAKWLRTNDSEEALEAFLAIGTKKRINWKNWVDKRTKFVWEFEKICKTEGKQTYSAISQTKAERTIQSLNNILYRYMEDIAYKYLHKKSQFLPTPRSRQRVLDRFDSKECQDSDFLSILYSKPLKEYREPNFKNGDRVRIVRYNLPSGRVTDHNFHGKFLKLSQFLPENLQHTK